MTTNTKRCTTCGEVKPLSEFYLNSRSNPNSHRSKCKDCSREYAIQYKKNGPSLKRKIINEWVKYGTEAYDKFSPDVLEAVTAAAEPIDPVTLALIEKNKKKEAARVRRREREIEQAKLRPRYAIGAVR